MIQCEKHYRDTLAKVESVIVSKWPDALVSDSNPLNWAQDHLSELYQKMKRLEQQINETWLNGIFAEMKKATTEWGRTVLEIFRTFAGHIRQQEAA